MKVYHRGRGDSRIAVGESFSIVKIENSLYNLYDSLIHNNFYREQHDITSSHSCFSFT